MRIGKTMRIYRFAVQLHCLRFEAIAANELWYSDTSGGRSYNLVRVGIWRPTGKPGFVASFTFFFIKLMLGTNPATQTDHPA